MFKPNKTSSSFCLVLLLFLEFLSSSASAQYALVGNAVKISPNSYRLTPDVMWQNGSVWNVSKIDLTKSFDISFEFYFGIHDINGADGISFTLQQEGTSAGSGGGGLGVFGVAPSLIVEYDTYENIPYSDPSYDHIGIDKNGAIDHASASNLAGPVQASATSPNIEDGAWHNSRVTWDAVNKKMEVYFDCSLRLTYTGDIINTIFLGNPLVYYGFTSATGGSTNEQIIRGWRFSDESIKIDSAICKGDTVQFDFSGYKTYSWQPATGISSASSPNPSFYPGTTTQYIVDIGNNCFQTWKDTVMIYVNPKPVVDLGPDQSVCAGSPAILFDAGNPGDTYLWSSGEISQTVSKSDSASYSVTVTNSGHCEAKDTVLLNVIPMPVIDLGPDIDICEGQSVIITSDFNKGKLLWSTGASTTSITADTNATIWLEAYYDSNCKVYDTVLTRLVPTPFSTLFSDTLVCFREIRSLTLDAGNGAQLYLWENGETSSSVSVTKKGDYFVTLKNGNCQIKDTVSVNEFCLATLFVPNAFTPFNKDGDNDVFYVKGISVEDFHLMIFNRWGELIHESFDITQGWDGYYQGNPVQVDVYVWKLDWKEEDDKMHRIGNVTVIN